MLPPVGGHDDGKQVCDGGDESEAVVVADGQQQVLGERVQLQLVRHPRQSVQLQLLVR